MKGLGTAFFSSVFKRSHGEEVAEFGSDKHSHLPQDLMILTFSRVNGKGNKGLQDKFRLTFFVILGQKGGIADVILRTLCDRKALPAGEWNLRSIRDAESCGKTFVGKVRGAECILTTP